MERVKVLRDWFPITVFDWEEILLGMQEDFIRLHSVKDYWEEHYSQDLLASKMIHGALLAALYAGTNLKMKLEYPMMFAGTRGLLYEDAQVKFLKEQCATSVVTDLVFTELGPAIKTVAGSKYLLIGGNQAWNVYPYLEDVQERPDLVGKIFNI